MANKKKLVMRATELLRDNEVRKYVRSKKSKIYISDDEGNTNTFVIKTADKNLLFNSTDVETILDACLAAIEECIRNGEDVNIHGFGAWRLNKRAARQVKHPETGEPVNLDEHYVAKFSAGNMLKNAAMVYDMSEKVGDRQVDYETQTVYYKGE